MNELIVLLWRKSCTFLVHLMGVMFVQHHTHAAVLDTLPNDDILALSFTQVFVIKMPDVAVYLHDRLGVILTCMYQILALQHLNH